MKTIETPVQDLEEVWGAAMEYVGGESYMVIPHGEYNHVAQINGPKPAVVKTPLRMTDQGILGMFHREVGVTDLLEERLVEDGIELNIEIPRLLGITWAEENPERPPTRPWAVYSYVPGETLSETELRERFSAAEFAEIGRVIGIFIFKTLKLVDMERFRREIDDYYTMCALDRLRDVSLQTPHRVVRLHEQGYSHLAEAVSRLRQEYYELRQAIKPTGIGHDDLHAKNLRIHAGASGNAQIVGVVDLANFKRTSPARELSFMALLHPAALRAAVEKFEDLSGESVDKTQLDFWYRLRCTMRCVAFIELGKPMKAEPLFGIQQAWPEVDWQAEFAGRMAV